ncbi:hypothetical protein VTN77DRAFT_5759 [Rasamsonia byssochlamydoides]|uniref:uncharacterized protein n=1 Tax=Rasamsonia byssochlamydoides TaxID=89139 RepID=UPI0037429A55
MLKDLALPLVVVSYLLLGLSCITLILRSYVRISRKTFAVDDYLMLFGLVLFIITVIMSTLGAVNGVGVHHYGATAAEMEKGIFYFTMWQLFYVTSTAPVKASICLSLIRITPVVLHQRILWSLITASVISTLIACIVVFTTCYPMAALWDKTIPGAKCSSLEKIIALSYVVSAINIVTDWVCALMPIFILWNVQMRRKLKISVCLILGMGVFASTATLVRLKTIPSYRNTNDYLYGIAEIAIWSAVEVGLAIIAGSVATLKPLFNRIFGSTTSPQGTSDQATGPYSRSFRLHGMSKDPTVTTVHGRANKSADELSDEDTASQERILRQGPLEGNATGIVVSREVTVQQHCFPDNQFGAHERRVEELV